MSDKSSLSQNVLSVLEDYDSILCVSAETLRELIVAYRNKRLLKKDLEIIGRHDKRY